MTEDYPHSNTHQICSTCHQEATLCICDVKQNVARFLEMEQNRENEQYPELRNASMGYETTDGMKTSVHYNLHNRQEKQVAVQFSDVPNTYRFRFKSDYRNKGPAGQGQRDVPLGEIKIENAIGKVTILLELVDKEKNKHSNQLRLRSRHSQWAYFDDDILSWTGQISDETKILKIPSFVIIREKQEVVAGHGSSNSPAGRCEYAHVTLHCRVLVNGMEAADAYSKEITDIKSSVYIEHVNPISCPFDGGIEITVLGQGFSNKSKIDIGKEITPQKVHKKVALVFRAPSCPLNQDEGGTVNFTVMNDKNKISNSATLYYMSKHGTNNDPMTSQPPCVNVQYDTDRIEVSGEDDEDIDEPDTKVSKFKGGRISSEELIAKLAQLVATGDVRPHQILCSLLASSNTAMLSLNNKGYTPLAVALLRGNFSAAEALLKAMPTHIRDKVMNHRFENKLSHLLILPSTAATSIPKSIIMDLINASDKPLDSDIDGNSLLHLLVIRKRSNDVKMLLEQMDEPEFPWLRQAIDLPNKNGDSPYCLACLQDDTCSIEAVTSAMKLLNLDGNV